MHFTFYLNFSFISRGELAVIKCVGLCVCKGIIRICTRLEIRFLNKIAFLYSSEDLILINNTNLFNAENTTLGYWFSFIFLQIFICECLIVNTLENTFEKYCYSV